MMKIPASVLSRITVSCKHYCVITHGGKVISTGFNSDSDFKYNGKSYRCHAECVALRNLPSKYRIKGTYG